jgi:hypothetical protein
MQLFHVKANGKMRPWHKPADKVFAFVIRADSELEARGIAARHSGDEGVDVWFDPEFTTCEVLFNDGEMGVVVCDMFEG